MTAETFNVTTRGFAAAIFDGSAAVLLIRADQPAAAGGQMNTVRHGERFERDVLPCLAPVYRAALCLTGDPGAAEDLVVEAFARAYRTFPRRPPGLRLEGWLYRILVDVRGEQRRAVRPAGRGAMGDEPPVRQALRSLPEDLRFAVYLADVDSFSYREIAEITGTSTEVVATRLRDARRSVRRRLSTHQERP
jgi:RNA polymerase sigma-70 factor (ECF subfamily)